MRCELLAILSVTVFCYWSFLWHITSLFPVTRVSVFFVVADILVILAAIVVEQKQASAL